MPVARILLANNGHTYMHIYMYVNLKINIYLGLYEWSVNIHSLPLSLPHVVLAMRENMINAPIARKLNMKYRWAEQSTYAGIVNDKRLVHLITWRVSDVRVVTCFKRPKIIRSFWSIAIFYVYVDII